MKKQLKTGVYKITTHKGFIYIGSARLSISRRWKEHINHLKQNKHHNTFLQRYFNKYGESSLTFEILATCPKEYCFKLEQWFLDRVPKEKRINVQLIVDEAVFSGRQIEWIYQILTPSETLDIVTNLYEYALAHNISDTDLGYTLSGKRHNKKHNCKSAGGYCIMSKSEINEPLPHISKEQIALKIKEISKTIYQILTPSKQIVTTSSLEEFGRLHNLSPASLGKSLSGKTSSGATCYHCGKYKLLSRSLECDPLPTFDPKTIDEIYQKIHHEPVKGKHPRYLWRIESPTGEILTTKSCVKFCAENDLIPSALMRTYNGFNKDGSLMKHHKYRIIDKELLLPGSPSK